MLVKFCAIFLLLFNICALAQYSNNFAYEWKTPADCAPNEAYNSVVLKCKTCEADQISSQTKEKCVCRPPFKTVVDKQQKCVQCAQGKVGI
jgi:hypothetical protein